MKVAAACGFGLVETARQGEARIEGIVEANWQTAKEEINGGRGLGGERAEEKRRDDNGCEPWLWWTGQTD